MLVGVGGGEYTIIDILKMILTGVGIFSNIVLLLGTIKTACINYLNGFFNDSKPSISLDFWIETSAQVDKIKRNEFSLMVTEKLSNLLSVSKSLSEYLIMRHKYLDCDFSIGVKILSIDYSAVFLIPSRFQTRFNYSRLLKIIKNLNIKTGLATNFTFTKWLSILRSEAKVIRTKGKIEQKEQGKYYLFLSSKLMKDYFD